MNTQQIWQKQFVLSVCLSIENCTFQDSTKKVEYKINEHEPDADDHYSSLEPNYSEHLKCGQLFLTDILLKLHATDYTPINSHAV